MAEATRLSTLPGKTHAWQIQAALSLAALLASIPHPGASRRPPATTSCPPKLRAAALPVPRLLPVASLPAASGNVWKSARPRRWWLRQVRSDGGFDQTGAMLPGGEHPLTHAQLPGPPRFMEPRWEPGLRPAFSWHGAALSGALGTGSCPVSPRWCAGATGQTPLAGTGRTVFKRALLI